MALVHTVRHTVRLIRRRPLLRCARAFTAAATAAPDGDDDAARFGRGRKYAIDSGVDLWARVSGPPLATGFPPLDPDGELIDDGSTPVPLLCMPGALGTAETDFGPQLSPTASGLVGEAEGGSGYRTVIAFDPRGYGRSRPPRREFHPEFYYEDAFDAASLMRGLGIDRFNVLGWSDGANAAVLLASEACPGRVQSLTIVAGNAYNTREDVAGFEKTRDVASNWSQRYRDALEPLYGDDLQPMWDRFCDAMQHTVHDDVLVDGAPFGAPAGGGADGAGGAGGGGPVGDVCLAAARRLRCPALIVHGMKDPMVREEHARWFRDNLGVDADWDGREAAAALDTVVPSWGGQTPPAAVPLPVARIPAGVDPVQFFCFPDGKHNPHLRFADEFNGVVGKFLAELDVAHGGGDAAKAELARRLVQLSSAGMDGGTGYYAEVNDLGRSGASASGASFGAMPIEKDVGRGIRR